jgi:hypothetical protein
MSDKEPSKDADAGVRRFLEDYRSGFERRSWEERRDDDRRAASSPVPQERRSGEERRSGAQRRIKLTERRRPLTEPFAHEHGEQIRVMILSSGVEVACPRCNGNLLIGSPVAQGIGTVREVHCTKCRHHVVIRNLPGEPLDH